MLNRASVSLSRLVGDLENIAQKSDQKLVPPKHSARQLNSTLGEFHKLMSLMQNEAISS